MNIPNASFASLAITIATLSLAIPCFILSGCKPENSISRTSDAPEGAHKPLTAEAQAEFDGLNLQCSDVVWRQEIDMIERPETRPPNRKVSGEVSSWLADRKGRLAALGVEVKWDSERQIYELGDAQQVGAPNP